MSNIFDYAGFYFGKVALRGVVEKYGEDRAANMAATFHEAQIFPGDGSFQDSVEFAAKQLADLCGFEDVTIKRPGTLYIAIYEKGECLAFVYIDVYPEDKSIVMANGDTVGNLFTYGWKGLRNLERAAA